ncbi:MAG: glycosyltransferase [Nitrosomonadales bacterium]|nr:glycosyltransferase [Nitrosomonadales bacterium]
MNHPQPLISVIVAVYNGDRTLQQCIDSFARQTYANKELIVIDGGSRDGTVGLIKANQGRIGYWISEPDRGIYNAWNKGLKQAKGEWICFLGADDSFRDERVLEHMAGALQALPPQVRIAYGRIMLVDADGKDLHCIGEPWQEARERFRQIMSIPHPGMMHRRTLFDEAGYFDESYRIAGDYELLLRELKTGEAHYIPDVVTVAMMQGGISSDPANGLLAMQEMRRAQRLHGQRLPGRLWLMTTAKVYIRLLLWRVLGKSLAGKLFSLSGRRKSARQHG